jgi:hypothetical protein
MVDNHLGASLSIVYPYLLTSVHACCGQVNGRNESVVVGGIHTCHINANMVVVRIVELWILVGVYLYSQGMIVRYKILLG